MRINLGKLIHLLFFPVLTLLIIQQLKNPKKKKMYKYRLVSIADVELANKSRMAIHYEPTIVRLNDKYDVGDTIMQGGYYVISVIETLD